MTGTLVLGKLVERRSFLFYAYLASKKDESRVTTRRERNSSVVNGALVKVARPITPITRQEPTCPMLYWCDSFTDTFLLFSGDLPPAIFFFLQKLHVPSSITRVLAWETREPLFRRVSMKPMVPSQWYGDRALSDRLKSTCGLIYGGSNWIDLLNGTTDHKSIQTLATEYLLFKLIIMNSCEST